MKKYLYYFYIPFIPFLFVSSIGFGLNISGTINLKPIIAVFLVFYCITVLKAIFTYGILALYSIYLYTSMFFVYSRLYFDLTGYHNFLTVTFPAPYTFSKKTGFIFLCVIFLSHYILDIVYAMLHFKKIKKECMRRNYKNLQRIGFLLMILAFPLMIYRSYLQISYVLNYGYLSIYTGAMNENVPFLVSISGGIVRIGFLMILITNPSKKIFFVSALIYLTYALSVSLRGSRELLVTSMITMFYFYTKTYKKTIKLKTVFGILLFVVFFSIIIGNFRSGTKTNNNDSLGNLLTLFFYQQGTTIVVPLTVIEKYGDLPYHKYPFIFSRPIRPLLGMIYSNRSTTNLGFRSARNIELEKLNSLSSITTNELSPKMHLSGGGNGGSFLAEMYDCGGFIGVIFWSIMLACLINNVEKRMLRKSFLMPIYWFVVYSVIYLPRNFFFNFIHDGFIFLVPLFLFLVFLGFIFYPKKILLNVK
jgi:oligosaccharide repeat unit polymerase